MTAVPPNKSIASSASCLIIGDPSSDVEHRQDEAMIRLSALRSTARSTSPRVRAAPVQVINRCSPALGQRGQPLWGPAPAIDALGGGCRYVAFGHVVGDPIRVALTRRPPAGAAVEPKTHNVTTPQRAHVLGAHLNALVAAEYRG